MCRRNRRKIHTKQRAEIEQSLKRARQPRLFVDTHVPRSVRMTRLPTPYNRGFLGAGEVEVDGQSVPVNAWLGARGEVIRGERPVVYTRRSMWLPGVATRD
jgi:hypothetical protein